MPETYGMPEPEPTRTEEAQRIFNEVVAGQGVVRRTILYVLVFAGILGALYLHPFGFPFALVACIATVMLMATDPALA